MLNTLIARAFAIGTTVALANPAAAVGGGEDPALTELVQILRDRGVLEEDEYHALTAKAAIGH